MSSGSASTASPGRPERNPKRMRDVFWNALDAVDLRRPFGDAAVHPSIVDLLERFAIGGVAPDLADERDHRSRVLQRPCGCPPRRLSRRDPRYERDARAAGELAIRLRHVRGAALLPADNEAQPVGDVHQRVEHGEIAFPGDAECVRRALRQQVGNEDFAAGARCHREKCERNRPRFYATPL